MPVPKQDPTDGEDQIIGQPPLMRKLCNTHKIRNSRGCKEKVHGAFGLTTRAKLFANSVKMAALTQPVMTRIMTSFEIFI